MAQYKLIIIAGDEIASPEFENVVSSLKEAKIKADILLNLVQQDGCPDAYIEILPLKENLRHPAKDYRVWQQDCSGDRYFKWMKVGTWCRNLYMYLK